MSRSYKKVPYCGDTHHKDNKRIANRHVRRQLKNNPELNLNYGKYKRLFEQYDICDYYWFCTWEEYWENEVRSYEYFKQFYPDCKYNKEPDKKECYRRWKKWYRNK